MTGSRRHARVAAALLAVAAATAACAGDDGTTPVTPAPRITSPATAPSTPATTTTAATATAAAGVATTSDEPEAPLEFVDDRGETMTFDAPPRRVVAWEALVPALVELGIEPVGVLALNEIAADPSFVEAGVDTEALTPVSTEFGEVDLDVLAALEPDLILTSTVGGELFQGFADSSTQELAGRVAPFVVLDANADMMTGIERVEQLAVLLGADLASAANRAGAAAFDEAVAGLEAAFAAKPGLTAAFGGSYADAGLFIASAADYPELRFYESLGLDVFDAPTDALITWELVDGIDADVFLLDDRMTDEELEALGGIAGWGAIPSIAAGQYSTTWRFLVPFSRAQLARTIERMLPTLQAADPDVA